MIELTIEDFGPLRLEHLVCDFNGTLAQDGKLIVGVASRISELSRQIDIHVVTADTHGTAVRELASLPCTVKAIEATDQDAQKLAYVEALGLNRVVAIGNGRNDRSMLASVGLGIAVIGPEAAATQTLHAAHLVVQDINVALGLLQHPKRLIATLRS